MTSLSVSILLELSRAVERHLGLELGENRQNDLRRLLERLHQDLGFSDPVSCATYLASHPWTEHQLDLIARQLTIGETYFYRDTVLMRVLEDHLLPELIAAKEAIGDRSLRLWSVACSTGEEPYMLAMLLDRLLPDPEHWQVHLLATDINDASLAKARAGHYRDWSFRQAPDWLARTYFRQQDNGFQLQDRIRRRVTFTRLNLARPGYPSPINDTDQMDLVLCRNVLMYFSVASREAIVSRLYQALVPGGWLLGSPSEAGTGCFADFQVIQRLGRSLYRKTDPAAAVLSPVRQPPVTLPPTPRPRRSRPSRSTNRPRSTRAASPAPARRPVVQTAPAPETAEPVALDQARRLANLGRLADAEQQARQAVAEQKLAPPAHFLLASILAERGEFTDAIQAYQRTLYLEPGFIMAHVALAGVLQLQQQPAAARRHLRNADRLLQPLADDTEIPESDGLLARELRQQLSLMEPGDGNDG